MTPEEERTAQACYMALPLELRRRVVEHLTLGPCPRCGLLLGNRWRYCPGCPGEPPTPSP